MISRPLAVFSRPKGVRVHTRTRPRNTRDGWAHDDLALLDAVAQAHLVHRGEVTATEPVEAAIARIELLNPALNAVIMTSYEDALARAATRPSGRLAGVPYLLKNLVVERAGTPFTEGSRFLAGNTSTITSELVRRLEHPGLIVLGRTNSPEFGMVPACEPLLYGPTRNPCRQIIRPAAPGSGPARDCRYHRVLLTRRLNLAAGVRRGRGAPAGCERVARPRDPAGSARARGPRLCPARARCGGHRSPSDPRRGGRSAGTGGAQTTCVRRSSRLILMVMSAPQRRPVWSSRR